jgi:osmotically inducible protein OsmC
MAAVRRAAVSWQGNLSFGSGRLDAVTSGAFTALPVTWASRIEAADGRTSPEELLAAAHASCFSMAFSSDLAKAGSPPESLDVTSEIAFDRVDGKWTVVSSKLTVRGRVPGLDEERFRALADAAKSGCPISRALQGNVALSVEASLDR